MLKLKTLGVFAALMLSALMPALVQGDAAGKPTIGYVDFKECVDKSRYGKQEQTAFDNLKKQMDGALQDKQKVLQEISAKLNDPDYMDSLTGEAEAELKHKFRMQGQELAQQEEQCYQILGQTNARAVQKIQGNVEKAAATVAQQDGLMMIANKEAFFYCAPEMNRTEQVLAELDKMAAKEAAATP